MRASTPGFINAHVISTCFVLFIFLYFVGQLSAEFAKRLDFLSVSFLYP